MTEPNARLWFTPTARGALNRINDSDDPMLQALVEQVILQASIRRILVWAMVLVPIILGAIGVVLAVSLADSGAGTFDPYDY
ncbi:hypothetical protein ACWGRK_18520 [Saccharomonospora azurea]|uniref:Uncharacterized protein n=2 Tax=Saccharomonospora azurea TaxID=40988 RepID=H8GA42_9PSEU|nr:hypothetical protein [Saccharomonospora azurea]EHY88569.1 hypothetical protein SacazDRAFT_01645 [Saccharomonospora azurea NA-128]